MIIKVNDNGTIKTAQIPTKTSELTNDAGFITNAGVTSFNGNTGAVTYTPPVTSVNGQTGAVTISVPTATSDLTNDSGFLTAHQAVVQTLTSGTEIGSVGGTVLYAPSGGSSVSVDGTLSVYGDAADASITGGKINQAFAFALGDGTWYSYSDATTQLYDDDEYWIYSDYPKAITYSDNTNSVYSDTLYNIGGGRSWQNAYQSFGYNPQSSAWQYNDQSTGYSTTVSTSSLSDLLSVFIPTEASVTESDPVFTASPAYGITSSDITNWNSKTSNTGTITGVSVNGTSVATSGVANVTVPTKVSDLTNDSGFITNAGVTSFNGNTGAVTYTAPVTSVNGSTGAVTISVPSKVSDLTNDSGFISSYTETDPVFSSSAAAGISSSDITNWNSKTSNTGTITGVSVNGTSVATSGVANVTVPTKVSDLTNDSGFISSYTETDPTVPSWAKAASKPTYTASEVGALPSSTTYVSSVNGSSGAITGIQTTGNLVTSVSSSSTNSQYPSAKLFYDTVGNIEALLAAI